MKELVLQYNLHSYIRHVKAILFDQTAIKDVTNYIMLSIGTNF